jgi:hypothetical protein
MQQAAAIEALRKKERQDKTQIITKIDGFLSFTRALNTNVLFWRCFLDLTLCKIKLRCRVCLTLEITIIIYKIFKSCLRFCHRGFLDHL